MASAAIRGTLIFILFLFPIIQAEFVNEDNGDVNSDFQFNEFEAYDSSGFDDEEEDEVDDDEFNHNQGEDDGGHSDDAVYDDDDDQVPDYGLGTEDDFYEDGEVDRRNEDAGERVKIADGGDLDEGGDDDLGTQGPRNTDKIIQKLVPGLTNENNDQHPHTFLWKVEFTQAAEVYPGLRERIKREIEESLLIHLPNDYIIAEVNTAEVNPQTRTIEVQLKITTTAKEDSFKAAAYYLCQEQLSAQGYRCDSNDISYDRNSCPSGSFMCQDGSCLDPSTRCDNKFDCQDGSDEIDCGTRSSACSAVEFDCGDGMCIDIRDQCDGRVHCRDGRDESYCGVQPQYCNANQFECSSGNCIDMRQVCDGKRDCTSGGSGDEDDCFLSIGPSELVLREWGGAEFTCTSLKGKAVRWSRLSNQPLPRGFRDEGDGNLVIRDAQFEDAGEYVCSVVDDVVGRYSARATFNVQQVPISPTAHPPHSGSCGRDNFQCHSGKCIPKDYVCDADYDCEDQSDEANCVRQTSCEPNEFLCRQSNKCVSVLWRCDGDKDCGKHDSTDEAGCDISMTVVGCRKDEFACHRDNQCIPLGYHCDNQTDCSDFSDEKGCTPPTVPKPMSRKITGKRGHNLTLTCEAQGVPAPIIVWRLNWGHVGPTPRVVSNSERLTPYSKHHQLATTRSVLTIHRLHPEDEGAYSCEAINSLGSTFASPDTVVVVTGGDKVCRQGTFNSAAVDPRECLRCWCSGVTDQCMSADNLYYNMKTYNQKIGIFGYGISTRDHAKIEYLSVPSFQGNKLNIYGGKVEYDFFYNLTATPSRYPGPYVAAYIESPNKNLYYFLDEIPKNDVVHHFELPFTEQGWYKDESRRIPATRSDFMEAISQLEGLQVSCKFVDTIDTSALNHIRITESRTDVGVKAYLVEECQCPIGYTGYSCESCAELYQRDPISNQCVSSCNCNGHSETCTGYDPHITCVNCRDNTDGPRCDKCAPGFYGEALMGTPYDCKQCDCAPHLDGSPGTCWERDGEIQCDRCPVGSYGVGCRKCHRGYIPDSTFGCIIVRQKNCNFAGTERINPDQSCYCKQKVEGELCDRCVEGTFGLSEEHHEGCRGCQCFGVGDQCTEARDLYHETVRLLIDYQPADFDGLGVEKGQGELESSIVQPFYPPSHPTCVAFRDPTKVVQYWTLPEKFIENPLYIYQGKLSYSLYYQSNNPNDKTFAHDVILTSKDSRLTYKYDDSSDQPNNDNLYEVVFKEGRWIDDRGSPPDAMHFTAFLRQLTSIKIKAKFTTADVENRICDVQLERVSSTPSGGYAVSGFQKCVCQSGYEGLFCERCSAGFEEIYQGGNRYNCVRRSSEVTCPEGYYFEPRAAECKECLCPHSNRYIGGVISCEWRDVDYFCSTCPVGYQGDKCDMCNDFYVGYPEETYGRCEQIDIDIEYPEILRPHPENKNRTEAELNSDVTLRCNLIGSRPVGIRWYRANQIPLPTNSYVNPDDNYSLTIRRIQRNDAGVYYCQATNSEGEIDIMFDLYILFDDRPQLEIIPSPASPKAGDFFSLRCTTKNMVENPQITWSRRDGRPMTANQHQDGSLVFQRLSTNDRGQYMCQLKSNQGSASEVYDLAIDEDVIHHANEGSVVELVCKASDQRYLRNTHVYWLKDGRRIQSDQRVQMQESVLRINGVTGDDQGVYSCVVQDNGRETRSDVTLVVDYKTTQDQFTIVGQDVTLTCVLRPDQNPRTVYWLKDGASDLGSRTRVDSEYSLMIERTTLADSGMYTCVVETYTDEKEHQVKIYLRVQEDPRPSIQGANRVDARLDDNLILMCVVSGEQPMQVKWMRGNREVNDPNVRFDPFSNSLIIDKVQRQHAGVWTCLAENTHGNNAHHVNVNIEQSGPVTEETTVIDIYHNNRAELWCRLGEGNLGTIQWTKDEYALPPHLRLEDRNSKLILERAEASDAGTYTCSLMAEGRKHTKNFKLRYRDGRPKIQGSAVNNRVPANTDVTLMCIVTSEDEAVVRWAKDGLPIYEDDTKFIGRDNSLILRRVSMSDSGGYTCTAQNKHGRADYTVYVTVDSSEILPTKPGAHILEPRTIYVNIGQTADFICVPTGGIDIIGTNWGRTDGQRLDSRYETSNQGERNFLSIKGVRREDEGTLECIFTDSDFIDHKTYAELVIKDSSGGVDQRPSAKIHIPYDLNVPRDTAVRVECEVQGSDPLEVYWTHNNQITKRHINNNILDISRLSEADEGEYICYARNHLGTAAARVFVNVQDPNLQVNMKPMPPLEEFKQVKISCYPDSQFPIDSIEWTRHDGPLPPGMRQIAEMDGQSMFIPRCEKEDQGRYICTVYFVGGQKEVLYYTVRLPGYDYYPDIETDVDLGRRSPVEGFRVTITPYETSLTKDSSAMLSCNIEGNFSFVPVYEWFHDGKRINQPHTTTDQNFLMLRNAVLEQSGTYTCRVLTSVGHIYEQARVSVQEPTYVGGLLIEPRDTITLSEGDPLKIICTMPSDPRAFILWQTPYGETFQAVTTSIVNVDRVDSRHQGIYTCSADNQDSQKVQVIIEDRITGSTGLHVYPATTTLAKGQNVNLFCYGAPENTRIEWMKFRGVEPRTSDDWFPIADPNINARGEVLSVQQAEEYNTGLYKCMAFTRDGVKEAVGRLNIMSAPVLSISPSVARVKQGDRLELHCESGLDNTVYSWKRPYQDAPLSPYSVVRGGFLYIENVQESDGGQYICSATNDVGTAESVVDVIFTSDTHMEVRPGNSVVKVGGDLELTCVTGNTNSDNIEWRKLGGELPSSSRAYDYFLQLRNLREEDRGTYQCSFLIGGVVHTVETNVEITREHVEIQRESARVGDQIRIACQVYTHPDNQNARIEWLKDDQPILPHHKVQDSVLIITNAQVIDEGVYKCFLTNHLTGAVESAEVRLDIQVPPVIPITHGHRKLSVGSQTTLSCLAHGNPPPQIQWAKDRIVQPSQDGVLVVNVRYQEDFGEYVCTATNAYGSVKSIFVLEQGEMVPFFVQEPLSYLSLTTLGKVNAFKSVETSFRPDENDGLIMFLGDNSEITWPYISVALVAGRLQLKFGTGVQDFNMDGPNVELHEWHKVQITLHDSFSDNYKLIMDVDGVISDKEWSGRGLDIQGYIYFGGLKDLQKFESKTEQRRGFKGCISYLVLNNDKIDIGSEIYEVVQVRECPVCEKRPCQNGGVCVTSNTAQGYMCECLNGYSGDTCEIFQTETSWGNIPMNGNNGYPGFVDPSMNYGVPGESCAYSCQNGGECIFSYQGIATCECPLGFMGELCQSYQTLGKSLELSRDGYLEVAKDTIFLDKDIEKLALEFKVDLSNYDSLLFWQSGYPAPYRNQDVFAVFVDREGFLTFMVRSQGHEEMIKTDHWLLLGSTYDVFFEITPPQLKVYLDDASLTYAFKKPFNYIDLYTNVFIGGVSSSLKAATQGRFARHNSFSGCIWDIYNPYKSVESFTLSDIAITGRNARSCPVREKASLT